MLQFSKAVRMAILAAIAAPVFAVAQTTGQASTQDAPQTAAPVEASLGAMTLGYTYYSRPGADLKTHDADVADCAAEGARTVSFDEQINTGSTGGLLGALIGAAVQSAAHRGAAAAGLENCMVVRGWRVVKVPDDEGQALAKLAPADLTARMAPWIGADEPHGQIVRAWQNDAADAAHKRYSLRPNHTNDGQLSLTEATSGNLHQFKTGGQPVDSSRDVIDPKWPKKPLAADKLASAPDGAVILLVQIKGLGLRNGNGVILNRVGADKDVYPSRSDHGPDLVFASKGTLFAHKDGDMFAFAVPPGRWRVYGLVGGGPVLNFCLGAPAFQADAGEVVYAGSFDLSASDIGPDLDLAPAKGWLGARPQAQAVRPAVYVNGSRGVCGNNAIYALEMKGAPFEPGYAWGGAFKANPAVAVAVAVAAAPAAPAASPAAPAPAQPAAPPTDATPDAAPAPTPHP